MGHWTSWAGTVTVHLAGCGGHRVASTNALCRLTVELHEALALNDVENLTTAVTVPVVASTGLEADHAHPDGVRVERNVQGVRARRPGEVSRVHGLAVKGLSLCGDLHGVIVRAAGVCCLHEIQRPPRPQMGQPPADDPLRDTPKGHPPPGGPLSLQLATNSGSPALTADRLCALKAQNGGP